MTALAHYLSIALNLLAAISSGFAAYYWYQASKGDPPTTLAAKSFLGKHGEPNTVVDAKELVEWAQDSSKRNKRAAIWSMAAAGCAGLSWFLGLVAQAQTAT